MMSPRIRLAGGIADDAVWRTLARDSDELQICSNGQCGGCIPGNFQIQEKQPPVGSCLTFLVIPARLERATHSLEGCCSIQLSYGTETSLRKETAKISKIVYKPHPSDEEVVWKFMPAKFKTASKTFSGTESTDKCNPE